MEPREIAQVFNDSYERLMRSPEGGLAFYREFYVILMERSELAAEKLRGLDVERQVKTLQAAVITLMLTYGSGDVEYAKRLGERHGQRGLGIPPELYVVWLDCLIEAVSRYDGKFDGRVEEAWRGLLSEGIAVMVREYDRGGL